MSDKAGKWAEDVQTVVCKAAAHLTANGHEHGGIAEGRTGSANVRRIAASAERHGSNPPIANNYNIF